MDLGCLQGAYSLSEVSLVSTLQAGDWVKVSTPARCYFSTCITTMDQYHDSVKHAVLGLGE